MRPARAWQLVDHACRFCGARVLADGDDYRCSSCTARGRGSPTGICGCGLTMSDPPLFRCAVNPHQGVASPAEIVILCGGRVVGDG